MYDFAWLILEFMKWCILGGLAAMFVSMVLYLVIKTFFDFDS